MRIVGRPIMPQLLVLSATKLMSWQIPSASKYSDQTPMQQTHSATAHLACPLACPLVFPPDLFQEPSPLGLISTPPTRSLSPSPITASRKKVPIPPLPGTSIPLRKINLSIASMRAAANSAPLTAIPSIGVVTLRAHHQAMLTAHKPTPLIL